MKQRMLALVAMLLILSGCSSAGLTPIRPDAAAQKFANEETFVLYLGLSYCSACKIFRSIAEEVIEAEKITIYHMDFDKEDEARLRSLIDAHLEQIEPFPFSFPILYVVRDGRIVDTFSLVDTDNVRRFTDRMVANGVIQR
jgi:thioredoxin-like negative regulator of GroEL